MPQAVPPAKAAVYNPLKVRDPRLRESDKSTPTGTFYELVRGRDFQVPYYKESDAMRPITKESNKFKMLPLNYCFLCQKYRISEVPSDPAKRLKKQIILYFQRVIIVDHALLWLWT